MPRRKKRPRSAEEADDDPPVAAPDSDAQALYQLSLADPAALRAAYEREQAQQSVPAPPVPVPERSNVLSVRHRPTSRPRETVTLRQAIAGNGYSCYVFNNEGAQLAELAREASDAVPSGKYGDTFRTAGELSFLAEYISQGADATASVVHFIENGHGFALDAASTLLASAVVEQYGGVANLYVTALVPKDGRWAVYGDPDFDLAADVARKAGAVHVEKLLRQSEENGIGSPAYKSSPGARFRFHDELAPYAVGLEDLPRGATVIIVARKMFSGAKLTAALKVLRALARRLGLDLKFVGVAFGKALRASSGARPAEALAPRVYGDLVKAAAKELELCGEQATASIPQWGLIYTTSAPMVLKGAYFGSAATRTTSSDAEGLELVDACQNRDALRARVSALKLLQPRILEHQGELRGGRKASSSFNLFHQKYRPAWDSNNEATHRFRSTQVRTT